MRSFSMTPRKKNTYFNVRAERKATDLVRHKFPCNCVLILPIWYLNKSILTLIIGSVSSPWIRQISVCWLVDWSVVWLVGRLVFHYFLKRQGSYTSVLFHAPYCSTYVCRCSLNMTKTKTTTIPSFAFPLSPPHIQPWNITPFWR